MHFPSGGRDSGVLPRVRKRGTSAPGKDAGAATANVPEPWLMIPESGLLHTKTVRTNENRKVRKRNELDSPVPEAVTNANAAAA